MSARVQHRILGPLITACALVLIFGVVIVQMYNPDPFEQASTSVGVKWEAVQNQRYQFLPACLSCDQGALLKILQPFGVERVVEEKGYPVDFFHFIRSPAMCWAKFIDTTGGVWDLGMRVGSEGLFPELQAGGGVRTVSREILLSRRRAYGAHEISEISISGRPSGLLETFFEFDSAARKLNSKLFLSLVEDDKHLWIQAPAVLDSGQLQDQLINIGHRVLVTFPLDSSIRTEERCRNSIL